jgi:hypothetical protein
MFRVHAIGSMVEGFGFMVKGLGLKVRSSWMRDEGL